MTLLLTDRELKDLTGRVKYTAQAKQLDAMGIPYRRRTDGSLVVLLTDVDPNHPDHHATPQTRRAPELRL